MGVVIEAIIVCNMGQTLGREWGVPLEIRQTSYSVSRMHNMGRISFRANAAQKLVKKTQNLNNITISYADS